MDLCYAEGSFICMQDDIADTMSRFNTDSEGQYGHDNLCDDGDQSHI